MALRWLRSLVVPSIAGWMLSRERLLSRRARAEGARLARGERHAVHYFHQVDDPYSALVALALPRLGERYEVALVPHVVGPPPDSAAPERAKLVAFARRDAGALARRFSADLAFTDPGAQPSPEAVARATRQLVAAIAAGSFVELAGAITAELWREAAGAGPLDSALPEVLPETAACHVRASDELRRRMGHYLGAMFHYAGEWYWGIDRLHHLEARLAALGAARVPDAGVLFPPSVDLAAKVSIQDPPPIDFFFSLRSPYSAIVAPRVFSLGRLTGARVRLRFVLPMVMRGLAVPRVKRAYIAEDAAREAFVRGIPFGRVNDPLGAPAERGLALIPCAERAGVGERYVLSFMRAVWAEGVDAGTDRGLRAIALRAGLSWEDARAALRDSAWRRTAEENRAELSSLGLWGVPSFRVRSADGGDVSTWGQDRLWVVEEALLARQPPSGAGSSSSGLNATG
jgi:2-hydroxychromene-2-carboxylate isomerase